VFREAGRKLREPAFGDEHVIVDDNDDLAARNPQRGIPRRVRPQGSILTHTTHRPTSLGNKLINHSAGLIIRAIIDDDYFGGNEAARSRRKRSQATR
jgi:hypothetical protein